MLARKSIRDTAQALGVTEGSISQWELGMSSPSVQSLEAFASYLEMPMDTMLDRPGAPLSVYEWYLERQGIERGAPAPPAPPVPNSVSGRQSWRVRGQERRATAPQQGDDESSAVRYRGWRLPEALAHSARTLAPA